MIMNRTPHPVRSAVVFAAALIATQFFALLPARVTSAQAVPAELSPVVTALEAHDIDALVARVRFVQRGCVLNPGHLDPPACPAGRPVDAFYLSFCDQRFTTTQSAVRDGFVLALPAGQRSSVYAVLRGGLPAADAGTDPGYAIVLAAGQPARAESDAVVWYVTPDAAVVGLEFPCGPPSAGALLSGLAGRQIVVAPPAATPPALPGTGTGGDLGDRGLPFGRVLAATVLSALAILALWLRSRSAAQDG
jgi:hypothetical protein